MISAELPRGLSLRSLVTRRLSCTEQAPEEEADQSAADAAKASPIPERPGETAAGHAGLDFGTLTDITTGPGGALILQAAR